MFLNISIKSILKSKWLWLGFSFLLIVISVIIWKSADRLMLGEKIISEKISPFEAKSYYSEYDMTIVSNKNVNTYFVKEWFDSGKHRFEFLDKMNNVVQIIVNEEKIYISNVNEKNKLTLNNLNYGNNITSFSTLISMYNCSNNIESNCECNITQYEKDGKITAYIELKQCECKVCSGIDNVAEIIVELDGTNKTPLVFTTYDKDKNVISSIVYTKFEMNMEIEDSLFVIS